jgi:pyrroloquinoline-quinone synthase
MIPDLQQRIDIALEDIQLLDHPFYRRWVAGNLKRDELTHYAEQYRFFEAMLPSFLQQLSVELSPGAAKDFVDANLADEVTPPTHVELFDAFARFYDAKPVSMSPATTHLVDAYAQVLRNGSISALAGLYAYESQGAAIADSKAAGLNKHYAADETALEFWREHGSIEGDHARWTFDALASLDPDLNDVSFAAQFVGEAWWAFLDERELQSAWALEAANPS